LNPPPQVSPENEEISIVTYQEGDDTKNEISQDINAFHVGEHFST